MKLSARNQFPGTVTKVAEGAVNGTLLRLMSTERPCPLLSL